MAPRAGLGELLEQGKYIDAIKQLDVLIQQHAGSQSELASLYANRAWVHQKLDLHRKSLKDVEAALALDACNTFVLVRKAQLLAKLGKHMDMEAIIQQAIDTYSPLYDAGLLETAIALRSCPSSSPSSQLQDGSGSTHINNTAAANGVSKASNADTHKSSVEAGTSSTGTSSTGTQAGRHTLDKEATATAGASPPAASHNTTTSNIRTPTSSSDVKQSNILRLPGGGHVPLHLLGVEELASISVEYINNNNIQQALQLLDRAVELQPQHLASRVARGTARALALELQGAIEDFDVAIQVNPSYADSWKRRGQALAALDRNQEALDDLTQALQRTPQGDAHSNDRASMLFERGVLYHKLKHCIKAAQDLQESVSLNDTVPQVWAYLGTTNTNLGNVDVAVAAFQRALALDPTLTVAWLNLGHILKEAGCVSEASAAFARALQGVGKGGEVKKGEGKGLEGKRVEAKGSGCVAVWRLMVQMKQGCGDHVGAIEVASRAMEHAEGGQRLELLYWRGVCHHALGNYAAAVADYNTCFSTLHEDTPPDTVTLQVVSFYLKELALYAHAHLDTPVDSFCFDRDIHPMFKEMWCKKAPPDQPFLTLFPSIAQPPLPPPPSTTPHPPPPPPDQLHPLLHRADALGGLLQYRHQGFAVNTRQQRMAGLAVLELAQLLADVVENHRCGITYTIPNAGASCAPGPTGVHDFGWRDAMDVAVRWRQLSEPNDQVVWVDLLTREEFERGFGSHTPMFSGQTKCMRYYMNFERALELHKRCLLEHGCAYDSKDVPVPIDPINDRPRIMAATTAHDMYNILQVDSWVLVHIHSVSRNQGGAAGDMEGTRLTIVKVKDVPDGYEFSIRTPVTPQRWAQFDKELSHCFDRVLTALAATPADKDTIVDSILDYVYYWYNFMPLARGSAVVGYIVLLAMFLTAGMPITASIPENYQVDWEAILSQHPDEFKASVKPWLVPHVEPGTHPLTGENLPRVASLLPTYRARIEALNGPRVPRI